MKRIFASAIGGSIANPQGVYMYLVLRVRAAEQLHLDAPQRLSDSLMDLEWTGQGWLEWTNDLGSLVWNLITPAPVPPWFEDIAKASQRFYRLRVQPPDPPQ